MQNKHWGARRTPEPMLVLATHMFTQYSFHDVFFIIQLKVTCLVIDSLVAEMFAASIEPKEQFVGTYGCCMSRMFRSHFKTVSMDGQ